MLRFAPSSTLIARADLALVLALALVACHESEPPYDPLRAVALETAINPSSVGVGERVAVACTRLNGHGEPLPGGVFAIGVAPTELVFVEGSELLSQRAGLHYIACNDPENGLVDGTPSELMVIAGPAVRTTIKLTPSTIAAGQSATVTCLAVDEYGNPAGANLRLEATPNDSVTIDGTTAVSATKAGSYDILCFAANVEESERARASLTVTAGPKVGMHLRFEPEQLAYRLLQQVTVLGEAVDAYGNALPEAIAVNAIDAAPGGHHRVLGENDEKIRFDLEGVYTVSAQAVSDPSLSATAALVVDQTKPVLTLTSPERGIVTDSLESVTLAGTVSDNLGRIGELRVGELSISVAPEGGAFSIDVPLGYAVNLLDVHALDPYGNEAIATRAVEKSSDFYPLQERTFEADGVSNAAVLVLLQAAFDDGDHTEPVRDDLAHLFEFIVENLDLASLLPNPLTTFDCIGGKCTLEFDSVTFEDVSVTMTLIPGRIHVSVVLDKLAGTVILHFPCDTPVICVTRPMVALPGTVAINRVTVNTDLYLAVAGGGTEVETENTSAEIDGFDVTIPDPTGLAQAAITFVVTFLREGLVDALEGLVVGLIENELERALGGLFDALTIDQKFELPSPVPGQPPNIIAITTKPRGVDIAPERLQLRLDGLSYASLPQRPHETLGSISHRGCAPPSALTFPPPTPMVVGLHDDFINQLLFAIWEGGTLSLDLGPEQAAGLVGQFGLQDASITVDALLPPVFNSCGADGVKTIERAQLGDLWLEVDAKFAGEPLHLGLWILTEAPVSVEFVHDEEGRLQVKLVLGALEPMWIEVAINEGRFAGNDEAVASLVQSQLVPQLLSTLTESTTFTLPSIDLGALTSAVPAGTVINLDVRAVARDNAHLTVQGALQ